MVDKPNLEYLKKSAKTLKKQFDENSSEAIERIRAILNQVPDRIRLADCQHVIAREQGYESWPKLKFSIEAQNMTRVERIQQLIMALYYGRFHIIDRLLEMDETLGDTHPGIQVALYKKEAVFAALEREPALVSRLFGPRSMFLHLCYSRYFQHKPEKVEDMLAIARRMIELGADVNDSYQWEDGSPLSALYGALGHSNNIKLAELLLENGANPNDGESLYHSTELGHLDGIKLLMKYGVDATSDHHWIRILDFDEYEGAKLLLEYGANINPPREDGSHWSVLHHAIKRGRRGEFAKLLLKYGADIGAVEDGHGVYGYAYIHNNMDFCKALQDAGCPTDITQQEYFLNAIMRGDASASENIKKKNPDIFGQLHPSDMFIPANSVTQPGSLAIFRAAHAAGWDLNTMTDEHGMPVLHIAAWNGGYKEVEYFLQFKPDLELQNYYGGTALGTAIHGSIHCPDNSRGNYIECIELLLAAGARLEADKGHMTMGSEEVYDYLQGRFG